jgi:hypothetical protein
MVWTGGTCKIGYALEEGEEGHPIPSSLASKPKQRFDFLSKE